MRILYVNKLYPPDVGGGAEVTLASIVQGVKARGVEARVITTTARSERVEENQDGVSVVRLPLRNVYWHNDQKRRPALLTLLWHGIDHHNLAMEHALRQEIRAFRPDLVSFHNLAGFSASAWDAASRCQVPAVQVLHDYYHLCARSQLHRAGHNCQTRCTSCRVLRAGRGLASRKLQAVVGISQAVLDKHVQAGLFRDVPTRTVIHNARKLQRGAARVYPSRARTFGYLGTLGHWKGIEQLLAAFARVREQPGMAELRLVVGGRGDEQYEAQLKRRFSGSGCEFLGQVKPQHVLDQSDVVVVPSLWEEPLGMVAVEALMQGIPVVGAARGGIPETVRDHHNGLLYDPDQPGALENRIHRLAHEPGLVAQLGAAGPLSVQRFTDTQRMVNEYIALYESITHHSVTTTAAYAP